jgi:hypothetical protein
MEPDEDSEITRINLSHTFCVNDAVFQALGIVIHPVFNEMGQEYSPTLGEILENYLESADTNLANAKYDLHVYKKNTESTSQNKQRLAELKQEIEKREIEFEKVLKYCEAGKKLYLDLKDEIAKITSGKGSALVIDQIESKKRGTPQITKTSFKEWYGSRGGGTISNPIRGETKSSAARRNKSPINLPEGTEWEDLTIKLTEDQVISIYLNRRKKYENAFKLHGLSNPGTGKLNKKGEILYRLCRQEKYRPSSHPSGANKKTMSELRTCLKKMTGLIDDPFFGFNPSDGWKPRFKLKNVEHEANKRAKHQAYHTGYHENEFRDYEPEDDDADDFLRDADPDY